MREFNTPQAERILQACKERGTKVIAVEEVSRNFFKCYQRNHRPINSAPDMRTSSFKSSIEDEAAAKRRYTAIAQKVIGHTVRVSIGSIRIEEVESGTVQTQGSI